MKRLGLYRRATLLGAVATLSGCSVFQPQREPPPPPEPPKPQYAEPLATHTFPYDPKTTAVVGTLQATIANEEDTLSDIARRFNLGYDEVVNANPGVDPWLPKGGTRIVLPTQFVLPDAPHEGIVVNLAALRMYYFPKAAKGEQRTVVTVPIGIGMVGWATPEGTTKIVSKRKDPVWTPPASVRKEHAAEGDILPAKVPAGPDNPLGAFAMNLSWPSYLMHGTNKPAGVGMRASHGCIRLYPEDIATLFPQLPIGTKVTVVNQPLLYKVQDGQFYVQSFPPHEEHPESKLAAKGQRFTKKVQDKMAQRAKAVGVEVDWTLAEQVVNGSKGVAVPVSQPAVGFEPFVATARLVENRIPAGATWDGSDRPVPIREAANAAAPVAASGTR
ncbi:MAG: L,D-transpeptidase family protein [Gammaproteobacteria bacterium]|nr:L,D-transpeptidase family protein [Gammaproteobacteria bacterium]MDH5226028.1 L,D-transpeptidase family protein [Gammaproteobacteria bacterium]